MSNCRAGDVPPCFCYSSCVFLSWNEILRHAIFFPFMGGKLEIHTVEYRKENTEHLVDALTLRGLHFCLGGPAGKSTKKHHRLISAIEEMYAIAFRFLNDFTGLGQVYSTTASDPASGNSQLWRFTAFERACVAHSGLSDRTQSNLPSWTCEPCAYACLVSVCSMVDITPDEYLQAESRTSRRALSSAGRGQLLSSSCADSPPIITHPTSSSATPETASDFNKLRAFALSMTARLPNIQMIYPADPGMICPAV